MDKSNSAGPTNTFPLSFLHFSLLGGEQFERARMIRASRGRPQVG